MGSIPSETIGVERQVATIFNHTIAGWAIGAAWEVGLLDEVRNASKLDGRKFAIQRNLHAGSLQGVITSLVIAGILDRARDGLTVVPGKLFDETYRTKSLFHWLSLGSGALFSRMQYVLRNENRQGDDFYQRDPAAIAYACRDINAQYFDPAFRQALDELDFDFSHVVDLGCGSGGRLMQILDRNPRASGLGVDIAVPSLQVGEREAVERGLSSRLRFTEGDARALDSRDEFANVDLLTCFMMGHDFWPRQNCVETLKHLRSAFPKVKRFLLGDATRILLPKNPGERLIEERDTPVFTLGFELGHELMGEYMPTLEEWDGVFGESGWRCVKKHIIDDLSLSVVFVLEKA